MVEVMPIGDPLLPWPMKKADKQDLTKPLFKYLRDRHGKSMAAKAHAALLGISSLRTAVLENYKKDITSITCKNQFAYCACLTHASAHFPLSDGGLSLNFTWFDPVSKKKSVSSLLVLEVSSVVFNAASAHMSLGAQSDRSKEGLARTKQYLQTAAGLYENARFRLSHEKGLTLTPDLTQQGLTALHTLCMVQTLHMHYLQELLNSSPASWLARVATDLTQDYAMVSNMFAQTGLSSSVPKEMYRLTQLYSHVMEARAHIHLATALHMQGQYGEELARLQRARYVLRNQAKVALKGLPAQFPSFVSKLDSRIEISIQKIEKLVSARQMEVPVFDALPALLRTGKQLVRPMPYTNGFMQYQPEDPFQGIPLLPHHMVEKHSKDSYKANVSGLINRQHDHMAAMHANTRNILQQLGVHEVICTMEDYLNTDVPPLPDHVLERMASHKREAQPHGNCFNYLHAVLENVKHTAAPSLEVLGQATVCFHSKPESVFHKSVQKREGQCNAIVDRCDQLLDWLLESQEAVERLDWSPTQIYELLASCRSQESEDVMHELKRKLGSIEAQYEQDKGSLEELANRLKKEDMAGKLAGIRTDSHNMIKEHSEKEYRDHLKSIEVKMQSKTGKIVDDIITLNARLVELKRENEKLEKNIIEELIQTLTTYENVLDEGHNLSGQCAGLQQDATTWITRGPHNMDATVISADQPEWLDMACDANMSIDDAPGFELSSPQMSSSNLSQAEHYFEVASSLNESFASVESDDDCIRRAMRESSTSGASGRQSAHSASGASGRPSTQSRSSGSYASGTSEVSGRPSSQTGCSGSSGRVSNQSGAAHASHHSDDSTIISIGITAKQIGGSPSVHTGFTAVTPEKQNVAGQELAVDTQVLKEPTEAMVATEAFSESMTPTVRHESFRESPCARMPSGLVSPRDLIRVRDHEMENVTKMAFNIQTGDWTKEPMRVYIEPEEFDQGTLRRCYKMIGIVDGVRKVFVAKNAINERDDDEDIYMADVETQELARCLGDAYNTMDPPKRVQFLEAFLIRLDDRIAAAGGPTDKPMLMHVEEYLPGEYKKYNNNYGQVSADARNTPQAFSHFTYEHTNGKYMVVDIQGVNDMYTDPQVHSEDKEGFGVGNHGPEGMDKFFSTHECSLLCQHLGLPALRKKLSDLGTKPNPPKKVSRMATQQKKAMMALSQDSEQPNPTRTQSPESAQTQIRPKPKPKPQPQPHPSHHAHPNPHPKPAPTPQSTAQPKPKPMAQPQPSQLAQGHPRSQQGPSPGHPQQAPPPYQAKPKALVRGNSGYGHMVPNKESPGQPPSQRSGTPSQRGTSPAMRGSSPAMRTPSPGLSMASPAGHATPTPIRASSPSMRGRSPGLRSASPGMHAMGSPPGMHAMGSPPPHPGLQSPQPHPGMQSPPSYGGMQSPSGTPAKLGQPMMTPKSAASPSKPPSYPTNALGSPVRGLGSPGPIQSPPRGPLPNRPPNAQGRTPPPPMAAHSPPRGLPLKQASGRDFSPRQPLTPLHENQGQGHPGMEKIRGTPYKAQPPLNSPEYRVSTNNNANQMGSPPLQSPPAMQATPQATPTHGYNLQFYKLTEEQFQCVVTLFKKMDKTNSGTIGRQDLIPLLKQLDMDESQGREMIRNVKGDSLNFHQFLGWWTGVDSL